MDLCICLFSAVLGLCCCLRAVSGCGARASHHGGSSCSGAQSLECVGFSSWACGLRSCSGLLSMGSVAVVHGLG